MGKPQQAVGKRKVDSRNNSKNDAAATGKKPFNKAKWREQKYSNKAKLNRFEERRKKVVIRNYYKELKKSGPSNNGQHNLASTPTFYDAENKRKLSPYEMAKKESERLAKEKEAKRLERQRIQEERKAALSQYKDKKKNRFSQLSKRTHKGQPVMAGRMELLLEKIQKST